MLIEKHIDGYVKDKVAMAIDRLKAFEPPEGYYLAFSGGKDSQTIYHLSKDAGVKFDAHYNLTTVDPPEVVYFIRNKYPDVIINRPKYTMWQLIIKKRMPPTRLVRFCCEELKEYGGEGRFVITGVRWAESVRRKSKRAVVEVNAYTKKSIMTNNDNIDTRKMVENCVIKSKHILNPIVDWEDSDVWSYLNSRGIEHCKLYDEGFNRLGCIGCPMASEKLRVEHFQRWPKFKAQYMRTFEKLAKVRQELGLVNSKTKFDSAESIFHWWVHGENETDCSVMEGQMDIVEDFEDSL